MGLFLPLSVMEDWPDPGTPIRLVVKTWAGLDEHVGVALPSAGPGLVTIKLVNGYNLSFPSSYVEDFELMGEMPEPQRSPRSLSSRTSRSPGPPDPHGGDHSEQG